MLDDNYDAAKKFTYKYTSQRRGVKATPAIERALQDARDSTSAIKFNGKLEAADGVTNELDKE